MTKTAAVPAMNGGVMSLKATRNQLCLVKRWSASTSLQRRNITGVILSHPRSGRQLKARVHTERSCWKENNFWKRKIVDRWRKTIIAQNVSCLKKLLYPLLYFKIVLRKKRHLKSLILVNSCYLTKQKKNLIMYFTFLFL